MTLGSGKSPALYDVHVSAFQWSKVDELTATKHLDRPRPNYHLTLARVALLAAVLYGLATQTNFGDHLSTSVLAPLASYWPSPPATTNNADIEANAAADAATATATAADGATAANEAPTLSPSIAIQPRFATEAADSTVWDSIDEPPLVGDPVLTYRQNVEKGRLEFGMKGAVGGDSVLVQASMTVCNSTWLLWSCMPQLSGVATRLGDLLEIQVQTSPETMCHVDADRKDRRPSSGDSRSIDPSLLFSISNPKWLEWLVYEWICVTDRPQTITFTATHYSPSTMNLTSTSTTNPISTHAPWHLVSE